MPRTGIFKEIAAKRGITVSDAKREFMKNVTAAAKELAGTPPYGRRWFDALSKVLSKAYELLRSKRDIPSTEEILSAVRA